MFLEVVMDLMVYYGFWPDVGKFVTIRSNRIQTYFKGATDGAHFIFLEMFMFAEAFWFLSGSQWLLWKVKFCHTTIIDELHILGIMISIFRYLNSEWTIIIHTMCVPHSATIKSLFSILCSLFFVLYSLLSVKHQWF